jgi:hypothetical protein
MRHDSEFWSHQVENWRASGLTQREYCRRHRLTKGTLGYWASRLKGAKAAGSPLVEVARAEVRQQRPGSPIDLVVEGRYLLRLWPGTDPGHMREVLSVLESRA